MLDTYQESRRAVTPSLYVDEELDVPAIWAPGQGLTVRNDQHAYAYLRREGMRRCCARDRISVSHGGPVTCSGH